MKKVFEHPAHYEVGHCESILNSHGIATTIRNANISSLSGEVPFTSAYPELWILDDSAYEARLLCSGIITSGQRRAPRAQIGPVPIAESPFQAHSPPAGIAAGRNQMPCPSQI
jgi:Putative prokaryotic signal transducing protein